MSRVLKREPVEVLEERGDVDSAAGANVSGFGYTHTFW